jgi:hypothetical protein
MRTALVNRVLCMADGPRQADGTGTACVRTEGHRGRCQFVADDQVSVHLTPAGRAALFRALQADLQVEVARGR